MHLSLRVSSVSHLPAWCKALALRALRGSWEEMRTFVDAVSPGKQPELPEKSQVNILCVYYSVLDTDPIASSADDEDELETLRNIGVKALFHRTLDLSPPGPIPVVYYEHLSLIAVFSNLAALYPALVIVDTPHVCSYLGSCLGRLLHRPSGLTPANLIRLVVSNAETLRSGRNSEIRKTRCSDFISGVGGKRALAKLCARELDLALRTREAELPRPGLATAGDRVKVLDACFDVLGMMDTTGLFDKDLRVALVEEDGVKRLVRAFRYLLSDGSREDLVHWCFMWLVEISQVSFGPLPEMLREGYLPLVLQYTQRPVRDAYASNILPANIDHINLSLVRGLCAYAIVAQLRDSPEEMDALKGIQAKHFAEASLYEAWQVAQMVSATTYSAVASAPFKD
ncbi:hypothetical protein HMN09_00135000 [Mycena chlorophos]|uniref:Uncharacterized protein n=1 Tax=Mycena chlorophos TaxID=658473 RepID=A0A8H6TMK1_MYCCL|nr:hypothetical protein HMN09_00135000 [Mycena chlorophos]